MMCNCAKELAISLSRDNHKNGKDAVVSLNFVAEAYIRPFVIAKKKWENVKELRLSSRGITKHIKFKYCPICGQKLPENYNPYIKAGD